MRKRLYSETDDAIAPGNSEQSKEESGTSDTYQSIIAHMSEEELARGGNAILQTLEDLNADPSHYTDAYKTQVFEQIQEEQFQDIIRTYQQMCRERAQFHKMQESDFLTLKSLILELEPAVSGEADYKKKIEILKLMSKVLQCFKFVFGNAKVSVAGSVLQAFHFWQYVEKAATRFEILYSEETMDSKMVKLASLAATAYRYDTDSDAEPDSDDLELDEFDNDREDHDNFEKGRDDQNGFDHDIQRIERNTDTLKMAKESYPEMKEEMVQKLLYTHGMDLDKMHKAVRAMLTYYKESDGHDYLAQRATSLGVTWRFMALYTMYYEDDELALTCAVTAYQTDNPDLVQTLHANEANAALEKTRHANEANAALVQTLYANEANAALGQTHYANEANAALVQTLYASEANAALVQTLYASEANAALVQTLHASEAATVAAQSRREGKQPKK